MSGPSFADLFGWEWRHVGRSALLWSILLLIVLSFVGGAVNTARLHRMQADAQARTRLAEAKHAASLAERRLAYRAPVTNEASAIPYWQDPTNVSGFSQYFVFQHALKPHLPASPLSVGVSDVAPSRIAIKTNSLFGFDDSYDFENPRALALGSFDLGFAIVYLLPIGLILLFGLLVTFERDRGTLRLIAAQGCSARLWLTARMVAILAWTVPVLLAALVIALLVAGVSMTNAWGEVVAALLITLGYCLFWTGIAFVGLSGLPGAAAALGTLAGIWVVLTIGLPLGASILLSALDPAPSPIEEVNTRRMVNDAIQADTKRILAQAFASRADLRSAGDRIEGLDYATKLSFLVPETERRLTPLHQADLDHSARREVMSAMLSYVTPALGVEAALARLAGTDMGRQRTFEQQARAHQQRLRALLYPLVQREIVHPTQSPFPKARGRFNLERTDILPAFRFTDEPAANRVASIMPMLAWLILLGSGLCTFGLLRTRAWPRGI